MKTNFTVLNSLETQIKDLICVTKPYYALKNVTELYENFIQAEVTAENTTSNEAVVISIAEAGRHLAILGSCALAINNPLVEKHYYLANKAWVYTNDNIDSILIKGIEGERNLTAQAKVIELDLNKKLGRVETSLFTSSGELVYQLEVSYQVLKATLFQKVFGKNFLEETNIEKVNPYTSTLPISNITYNDDVLNGGIGVIKPEYCVGHFDNYPALPIAVLCSVLVKLGEMHMFNKIGNNNQKFYVKNSLVEANSLAFAGEHVFINSHFIEENNGEFIFQVNAKNENDRELGGVKITFKLID
jgi:hypothetical protein